MCVKHAVKVMEATQSKVVLVRPHPSPLRAPPPRRPLNSGRSRSESRTSVMEDGAK